MSRSRPTLLFASGKGLSSALKEVTYSRMFGKSDRIRMAGEGGAGSHPSRTDMEAPAFPK
jgi:hypothetical protein